MRIELQLDDDLEVYIKGNYTPEEEQVLYPVDEAYPGAPEVFEIEDIQINKGDIRDLLFWCEGRTGLMETLEELCIKQLKDD